MVHHYNIFFAFSTNVTVPSSWNCVWEIMFMQNTADDYGTMTMASHILPKKHNISLRLSFGKKSIITSLDLTPCDFHVFQHLKPFLLASSSIKTMRSNKLFTCSLHLFMRKGYNTQHLVMMIASTMAEPMPKSSATSVYQRAI